MKVILRTDMDNLGRLGDQVNVKPGYARNYLLPQGLAMLGTPANLKQFETERKKLQAKVDAVRGAAQAMADKLAGAVVRLEVRTGEGDRMYGSVTAASIAESLAGMGIELDKRKIDLDQPIRALGEFEVVAKLHPDIKGMIKIVVSKFGAVAEEAETPAAESSEPEAE